MKYIMEDVVIVTGSSRGIGNEIVKKLAKSNKKVILNYNKSEKLAIKTKKELEKENIFIDIFKANLSKREEAEELVEFTLNKYGKIDILINNAGISQKKLFTDTTDEDWNLIINNNLYSAYIMSKLVIPNMIHNKKGCIINISSIWGSIGASMETLYSISKAGMNGLTKSLAKEVGPSNVRVNSIAPGIINTNMNNDLNKEELNNIKEDIPLQKLGEKSDITRCVEWLIEDNYTTGQIICVNGGWDM